MWDENSFHLRIIKFLIWHNIEIIKEKSFLVLQDYTNCTKTIVLGAGHIQLRITLTCDFGYMRIKLYWAVIRGLWRIFWTNINVYKGPIEKNQEYNEWLIYMGL